MSAYLIVFFTNFPCELFHTIYVFRLHPSPTPCAEGQPELVICHRELNNKLKKMVTFELEFDSFLIVLLLSPIPSFSFLLHPPGADG